MKVLITGGMGFIGSHLAKACLNDGHDVTLLSRSDKKRSNIKEIEDRLQVIIKDVREIGESDLEGMDVVLHMAGSVDNYAIVEGEPYRDIEANCTSTIALLEACRNYCPKARIVFASTFFVNGNVDKLPADEHSPCRPMGLYGATRLAAEHFCHVYHKVFGLDIVIARFANVFGPFEQSANKKKAGFNYLINLGIKGEVIPVYKNGDFYRDYIYVTDVADACLVLAKKGETDQVYYVARGEYIKFRALIDIVVKYTGAETTPIEPPEFHKNVGIGDFVADVSKLKALGWGPKVSLDKGIEETVQYYRGFNE